MVKLAKYLAWIVGAIVALLVVVSVVVSLVIDPNDYRDEITGAVEQRTGRTMQLEGIDLSVFPWLGVELNGIELGNAPGFGDQPFVRADEAQIRVELLPLLRREVRLDTVVLDGLEAHLVRSAEGATNWEDLLAPAPAAEKKAPRGEGESKGPAVAALAVGGLRVDDATIEWVDHTVGQRILLKDVNLRAGRIAPGVAAPVDAGLAYTVADPELTGRLSWKGEVTVEPDDGTARITGLRVEASAAGDTLPVSPLDAELQARNIDFRGEQLVIDGLTLTSAGATADASLKAASLSTTPRMEGTLNLEMRDADTLARLLGGSPGFDPAGLEGARAALQFRADLGSDTAEVQPLTVRVGELELTGSASASKLTKEPQAKGHLESKVFSPRALAERLGIALPDMSGKNALSRARLALDFRATRASAAVDALTLEVDETTIKGGAGADSFTPPAVRYDLSVDRIDVDSYLPEGQEQKAASPGTAAAGAAQLPVEPLRALTVDGRLHVGELKAFGLHTSDIDVTLKGADGRFRLHPLQARLYGGTYTGDVRLDVTGEVPSLSMDETLAGVQAGPLGADLLGESYLTGTGELKVNLSTRGAGMDAMLKTLDGEVAAAFRDGSFKGFNLGQKLREALAVAEGRKKPAKEARATDFADLSGRFVIKDGVAATDQLSAKSPLFRLTGDGTANLVERTLDYRLNVAVVETLKGQGGRELEQLKGVTVPIAVTGPFTDPKIDIALASALKAKLKQRIEEEKSAQEEQLRERLRSEEKETEQKLKKELEKGLKGLLR